MSPKTTIANTNNLLVMDKGRVKEQDMIEFGSFRKNLRHKSGSPKTSVPVIKQRRAKSKFMTTVGSRKMMCVAHILCPDLHDDAKTPITDAKMELRSEGRGQFLVSPYQNMNTRLISKSPSRSSKKVHSVKVAVNHPSSEKLIRDISFSGDLCFEIAKTNDNRVQAVKKDDFTFANFV